MAARLAVTLAPVFAVFLGIAEVVRNWGDWSLWPFWLVDYICVGLLVWGWFAVKNRHRGGRVVLSGAWGFTCAMFYMSFFSHVYLEGPTGGPLKASFLTLAIAALFAVTVVAFICALVSGPVDPAP